MNSIHPRVGEISVINNYQSHLIAIRRGSWITTLGVSEEEGTQAWPAVGCLSSLQEEEV